MIPASYDLADGEEVVLTIRRHWFRVAVEGVTYVTVFIILGVAVGFGELLLYGLSSGSTPQGMLPLGLYLLGAAGLCMWLRFFAVWSDHWLDVWLVTDRRIIDVEHKGFFSRHVSSFPLSRIQDVTYTVVGIVPTWLHFGDVRIQTASTTQDLIMRQIPQPDAVLDAILAALKTKKQVGEDGPVQWEP